MTKKDATSSPGPRLASGSRWEPVTTAANTVPGSTTGEEQRRRRRPSRLLVLLLSALTLTGGAGGVVAARAAADAPDPAPAVPATQQPGGSTGTRGGDFPEPGAEPDHRHGGRDRGPDVGQTEGDGAAAPALPEGEDV